MLVAPNELCVLDRSRKVLPKNLCCRIARQTDSLFRHQETASPRRDIQIPHNTNAVWSSVQRGMEWLRNKIAFKGGSLLELIEWEKPSMREERLSPKN